MSLNYSFAGKKVLITGGGSGIGRQLVQSFYDEGASVFTLDKNHDSVQKLQSELPMARADVVDITDWEATRKLVESYGPIDHLVNNAAVVNLQNFMDITKEAANLQLDVNVVAAVNVTQTMAKGLIDHNRGGSVVNISSSAARIANPIGVAIYSASKAAMENLTKSMALELGPFNIRVNCILPGAVDTQMLHNAGVVVNDHVRKMMAERLIIKKVVHPKEIADLVMFLLSPLSSMIVGESVVIDGGWLAN